MPVWDENISCSDQYPFMDEHMPQIHQSYRQLPFLYERLICRLHNIGLIISLFSRQLKIFNSDLCMAHTHTHFGPNHLLLILRQTYQLLTELPQPLSLLRITGFLRQLVLERRRVIVPAPVHAGLSQAWITHHLNRRTQPDSERIVVSNPPCFLVSDKKTTLPVRVFCLLPPRRRSLW